MYEGSFKTRFSCGGTGPALRYFRNKKHRDWFRIFRPWKKRKRGGRHHPEFSRIMMRKGAFRCRHMRTVKLWPARLQSYMPV
jgi:hypothetical protein